MILCTGSTPLHPIRSSVRGLHLCTYIEPLYVICLPMSGLDLCTLIGPLHGVHDSVRGTDLCGLCTSSGPLCVCCTRARPLHPICSLWFTARGSSGVGIWDAAADRRAAGEIGRSTHRGVDAVQRDTGCAAPVAEHMPYRGTHGTQHTQREESDTARTEEDRTCRGPDGVQRKIARTENAEEHR